jgi:hypothetical protein
VTVRANSGSEFPRTAETRNFPATHSPSRPSRKSMPPPMGTNGTPDGFAAELEGALHVKEQEQIIAEVDVLEQGRPYGKACGLTNLALRASCSAKRTARTFWISSTWTSCQCRSNTSQVNCLMRCHALRPGGSCHD